MINLDPLVFRQKVIGHRITDKDFEFTGPYQIEYGCSFNKGLDSSIKTVTIPTLKGNLVGNIGDWIIEYPDGTKNVLTNEYFVSHLDF